MYVYANTGCPFELLGLYDLRDKFLGGWISFFFLLFLLLELGKYV